MSLPVVRRIATIVLAIAVGLLVRSEDSTADDALAERAEFERFLAERTPLSCNFKLEYRTTPFLTQSDAFQASLRARGRAVPAPTSTNPFELGEWIAERSGTWSCDGACWRIDLPDTRVILSDGTLTLGINPGRMASDAKLRDTNEPFAFPQSVLVWAAEQPILHLLRNATVAAGEENLPAWTWQNPDSGITSTIVLSEESPHIPQRVSLQYKDALESNTTVLVEKWTEVDGMSLPKQILRRYSQMVDGQRRTTAEQRSLLDAWRLDVANDPLTAVALPSGMRIQRLDGSTFTVGADPQDPATLEDQLISIYVTALRALFVGTPGPTVPTDVRNLLAMVRTSDHPNTPTRAALADRCGEAAVAAFSAWENHPARIQDIVDRFSPDRGMSLRELARALQESGVRASWRSVTVEQMLQLRGPLVLHLKNPKRPDFSHFVFAVVMDQAKYPGKLILYDHPDPPGIVAADALRPRLLSALALDDGQVVPNREQLRSLLLPLLLLAAGAALGAIAFARWLRRRRIRSVGIPGACVLFASSLLLQACGESEPSRCAYIVPSDVIDVPIVASGTPASARFSVAMREGCRTSNEVTRVVPGCSCLTVTPSSGVIEPGKPLEFAAVLRTAKEGSGREFATVLLASGDALRVEFRTAAIPLPQVKNLPTVMGVAGELAALEIRGRVHWPANRPAPNVELANYHGTVLDHRSVDPANTDAGDTAVRSAEVSLRCQLAIPAASKGRAVHYLRLRTEYGETGVTAAVQARDAYLVYPDVLLVDHSASNRKIVFRRLESRIEEQLSVSALPEGSARVVSISEPHQGEWVIWLSLGGSSPAGGAVLRLTSSDFDPVDIPIRRAE